MRSPEQITISSAIVHLVRRERPFYAQAELEIANHQNVKEFLESHIKNSLTHEQAQSANFVRDAADAVVFQNARSLLVDQGTLVDTSTAIAQHLHAAILEEGRASESAVAFCSYSDSGQGNARFLAVLKLEPGGAFQPVPGNDQNGRRIVKLKQLNNVLPTDREKLQKAAMVRAPGERKPRRGSFDLMVLDRQRRDGREPAGYFMDFLRIELALDSHSATVEVFNTMMRAVEDLRDSLSLTEQNAIRSAARAGICSAQFSPVQVAENLAIRNVAAKTEMVRRLNKIVSDWTFAPDPAVAESVTKRRKFKADHGVSLTIDTDASTDQGIFNEQRNGDVTTVTLSVRNWHEVRI